MKKLIASGILAVSLALALEGCSSPSIGNETAKAKSDKPYIVANLEDVNYDKYHNRSVYIVDKRTGILYFYSTKTVYNEESAVFTVVHDGAGGVVGGRGDGRTSTTPDEYFGLGDK